MSGNLQYLTAHLPLRPHKFFGGGSEAPRPRSGEGTVRSLNVTRELRERPIANIVTIPDILSYAVGKYGSQYAIGYRDVIQAHHEEKELSLFIDGRQISERRTWKLLEMSDYKYISYRQFTDAVTEVRNGLLCLGIQKDDVVNIYAQTG